MPRVKADNQLGMDEKVIQDPEVEQALEERQTAKDEMAQYRLAYKNADKRAKSMIERLEMPDPENEEAPLVVRVARFRITKKLMKGRTVSFATEDRVQLTIGLADEPDEEYDGTEDQDVVNNLAENSKLRVVDDAGPRPN